MDAALRAKRDRLVGLRRETDGCVIGFPGGVDSTFLYALSPAVIKGILRFPTPGKESRCGSPIAFTP